jgi:hypothetical protein
MTERMRAGQSRRNDELIRMPRLLHWPHNFEPGRDAGTHFAGQAIQNLRADARRTFYAWEAQRVHDQRFKGV